MSKLNYKLDSDAHIPLYYQLFEKIKHDIEKGKIKKFEALPTETELQKQCNVSRTTVRKSLDLLEKRGYIVRKQGQGTYVTDNQKVQPTLLKLTSFTEEIEDAGKKPGSKVLEIEEVEPSKPIKHHLEINSNSKVIKYTRLRTVDGEPIGIHEAYLNCEAIGNLKIKDLEEVNDSLYCFLKKQFALKLSKAHETIEAVKADKKTAKLLNISPYEPLLKLRRTTYNDAGKPFEYVDIFYRGDSYSYEVRMER